MTYVFTTSNQSLHLTKNISKPIFSGAELVSTTCCGTLKVNADEGTKCLTATYVNKHIVRRPELSVYKREHHQHHMGQVQPIYLVTIAKK